MTIRRCVTFTRLIGAHPTFLIHQSGEVETWDADDVPLGIDCEVSYDSSPPRPLVAGDILPLCSDGVWEAHAPNDSQFGMPRVFDLINSHRDKSSREIVELLFREVEQHTGRLVPDDDITIVVVKA